MTREECVIYDLFKELGVPANQNGYRYVMEAVKCVSSGEYDSFRGAKVSSIYADIAKKFSTTPTCAERCMRKAVESAFDNGDPEIKFRVFGNSISASKGKPTNSMFIFQCAAEVERRMSA